MSNVAGRRLFIASSIVIAALCFAGFARSYYLRSWFSTRTLSSILQVHGFIMTTWVALFMTQVIFVARHRIDLHRKLGVSGVFLAALILALGVFIIVRDIDRQSPNPTTLSFVLLFTAFDGMNLLLFAGFVGFAMFARRRPDVHKRLMLLATLSLLPPALGRLAIYFVPDEREPITKLALLRCHPRAYH